MMTLLWSQSYAKLQRLLGNWVWKKLVLVRREAKVNRWFMFWKCRVNFWFWSQICVWPFVLWLFLLWELSAWLLTANHSCLFSPPSNIPGLVLMVYRSSVWDKRPHFAWLPPLRAIAYRAWLSVIINFL